jgi:hypothetical protein
VAHFSKWQEQLYSFILLALRDNIKRASLHFSLCETKKQKLTEAKGKAEAQEA